jgi:hypothetical protein
MFTNTVSKGTLGIRSLIDEFHHKKIKVLFPVLPWDEGTVSVQIRAIFGVTN